LTIFLPYRPNGFLHNLFFLICAEATSARFLFQRYRGVGKCRDKNGKQKRRKNLPAVSASYDPSCVCSIVQFWWPPVFWEAHFDILRVLSQSEKLLIMLSTRACSAPT